MIHRDLKLENIMMTDASDTALPKIVDFGLAMFLGPGCYAYDPFGTAGYVAPEIFQS
jgi:serine/threonine protein kinase